MEIINPSTGGVVKDIPSDDSVAIAAKVAAAAAAQPAWAALPLEERLHTLRRFKEGLRAKTLELARTMTEETGKPLQQAVSELEAVRERIDFFVEHASCVMASETVLESPELEETIEYQPLGVVAHISAWNYPIFVACNVIVPALITGNAVIYKPSEIAMLTGLGLTATLHEAGVPQAVLVCVVGEGDAGEAVLEQPEIAGVFFTGSHATGVKIAIRVAPRLLKLQLELGGKDPAYVAEDVDVEQAAQAMAEGAFYNGGQSCCAVERIYVHEAVYPAFLDAFVSRVEALKLGDPLEAEVDIGPLARGVAQLEFLKAQVEDAVAHGGCVRVGGSRVARSGFFFAPTVVSEATHAMALMQEETFGPLIGVMSVASDDEAFRLMNDTQYGLTASVHTRDRSRAERLLAQLDVGSAYWNCCDRVSPRLPWSGRRGSGVGCTLSRAGIRAFLKPKGWHWRSPLA